MKQQPQVRLTDLIYKTIDFKGITLYLTSSLPFHMREQYTIVASHIAHKTSYFPFVCLVVSKSLEPFLEQFAFDGDLILSGREGRV